MAARRGGAGISGTALFLGVGGLYLAYVGIRDVPFVEGLRSVLRGEVPAGAVKDPSQSLVARLGSGVATAATFDSSVTAGDTGTDRLVGNAVMGYRVLKQAFPYLHFGGWRATGSVASSRHPMGKAVDVNGGPFGRGKVAQADATARQVIARFKTTAGARTWIWNRQIATRAKGWVARPYNGPSDHTDHVHLDWD